MMGPGGDSGDCWFITVQRWIGRLRIHSAVIRAEERDRPAENAAHWFTPEQETQLCPADFLDHIPAWSRVKNDAPSWKTYVASETHYDIEDAAGWPALSLRCAFDQMSFDTKRRFRTRYSADVLELADEHALLRSSDGSTIRIGFAAGNCARAGIMIEPPIGLDTENLRLFPLRPIPLGFVINTIFYATTLRLLFAAPGLVRRRRSIRRGLCAHCAYPVGSSPICTECGKPIAGRR